jgi:hypothetical protein
MTKNASAYVSVNRGWNGIPPTLPSVPKEKSNA